MSAKHVNHRDFYLASIILAILILSALNINTVLKPENSEVLGAETIDNNRLFWEGFQDKNPEYLPGWIELGRLDKVQEIDPNYLTP